MFKILEVGCKLWDITSTQRNILRPLQESITFFKTEISPRPNDLKTLQAFKITHFEHLFQSSTIQRYFKTLKGII